MIPFQTVQHPGAQASGAGIFCQHILRLVAQALGLGGHSRRHPVGLRSDHRRIGVLARDDPVDGGDAFGDLGLADGRHLFLGLHSVGAHGFGCDAGFRFFGGLLQHLDLPFDLGQFDRHFPFDLEPPKIALLTDARFLDAAVGQDARALDLLAGGDFRPHRPPGAGRSGAPGAAGPVRCVPLSSV